MKRMHPMPKTMTNFVDALQAGGRYTFTQAEAMNAEKRSDIALEAALRRLKQKGRIASPRRGFYVIVPVEYREAGCPPASWFIHDLMRFLDQPYYVGILSAAAIHGAAHQQPMLFQVVTDRTTRPARAGRVRIGFHMGRHIEKAPVVDIQTETGSMRVSTPEATAFDLVRFALSAGHMGNVITVLTELAEKIAPQALTSIAGLYATSEVQRLGYLLELLGENRLADPLAVWLKDRRYRPILLAPGQPGGKAPSDPRWRVIPNETVEVEF
ncbi:MAG: type IV toxin-antitoxin system AbiEi family antitoxin domain-containing protein [Syntrophales bacterium]